MSDVLEATTRYDRVIAILDEAAGSSDSDYGGIGPFWRLPRSKFLEVRVHGIRMIAPEEKIEDACPCCVKSRGESSGLIRGLRGDPPFDGTQFPPLPWGGSRVSNDDIAFISDWIDDGCPAADVETSYEAPPVTVSTDVAPIPFEVFEGAPNEYGYQYGEAKQRMNLDCLSPAQLERFRNAFRELYRLNKWPEDRRSYNNNALIHQNHCQHGWERFLPWHRIYLYEFEQMLQDFDRDVTIPYWDWTMPQYVPEQPYKGEIIPKAYKAFLTSDSIAFLKEAVPKLPDAEAQTLTEEMVDKGLVYTSLTTFFAAIKEMIGEPYTEGPRRDRFIDALLAANSLWYPLRYPSEYAGGGTINQVIHYHYPTKRDMEQIVSLRTFRDFGGGSLYNDSFGFLDQNPHNTMHIWTGGMNPNYNPNAANASLAAAGQSNRNRGVQVQGRRFHSREDMYSQPQYGDMFSNLTASYDPVFWPIHVNVDRLWHEWQQMNPQGLPADLDAVLTPWSYTIRDTIDMSRFGYEYVKCAYIVPVGLSAPVGRFVSKPIAIPDAARHSFRQAEVRLHRSRSCRARASSASS